MFRLPRQPLWLLMPSSPAPGPVDRAAEGTFTYACPICLDTTWEVTPARLRPLRCERCGRSFRCTDKIVDLTLTSGLEPKVYRQKFWGGTEIFQSPVVSFVYERGWRAGFSWAGFPGEEREYGMAMEYLRPAYGQVLLDMSCGSGLFSRRFAKSGKFSGVIAADFSENMLLQASSFFREDPSISPEQYALLRADVGRLPFRTASLAAVHAGAAIHCWPNPAVAVAEISRVLKPGGGLCGLHLSCKAWAPLGEIVGDDVVRPLGQLAPLGGQSRTYKWWEEAELRDLAAAAGLVDFQRKRSFRFIMFSAQKPSFNNRS
eukprot:jgi/Botrbrau1/8079/Bobra.0230s0006.1